MTTALSPRYLEESLRGARAAGRKLLVPYVTGGLGTDWLDVARAVIDEGADAIEIGIPFSDPMIDGPVIQRASQLAIEQGATPGAILTALHGADLGVPVVVMTYANIVVRTGYRRMAYRLSDVGVAGAIVPDLPVDECGEWAIEADGAGIATVLLAAPNSTKERLAMICARCRGFLYAVGLLGVTGERETLSGSATALVLRAKQVTDLPVLVGIGVSTPEQAAVLCKVADGVIVGSALIRRLLEGEGPKGAAAFVAALRRGMDNA
jgi:tryptophan synthase alpha chain